MIRVNTSFLNKRLQKGLDVLSQYYSFKTGSGIKVFCQKSEKDLKVTYDMKSLYISCPDDAAFYRGFGHFLQNNDREFTVSEARRFKKCGLMFDSSRNGVLNLQAVKYFLVKMALMGMNTFYPYMEDVYELESEPLFGYRRGKYTADELKEIDDFADMLGVEVIPCIQTLAHLNQFLALPEMGKKYRDTEDILMVGSKQTALLIEDMISTMSKCFRSRNIHVGMDEAQHIGRGRVLDQNGYEESGKLFGRHLKMVSDIADRYGMHLQIWDDMLCKGGAEDVSLPSNVTPVYRNYYSLDKQDYLNGLESRCTGEVKPVFAGGAWRWGGYVPKHTVTYETSDAALTACKEKGIEEVFVTSWGDDGDEGAAAGALFAMVLYAEHAFCSCVSKDHFDKRLAFLTGMAAEDWYLQEKLDQFGGIQPTDRANPSKILLYSDPLCGNYDAHIEQWKSELSAQHFVALSAKLKRSAEKCAPELKNSQLLYAYICDVLELKWDLSIKLREAYKNKDRTKLLEIRDDIVDYIIPRNEALRKHIRTVWEEWYGMYGFEVLDIRLGGVSARLKTIVEMIYEFDEGKLKTIPPIEEEPLPIRREKYFYEPDYSVIASASKLS